jgi:16S rRNA C967 or C1407 C5-methylase (RsmB/RsmF family)
MKWKCNSAWIERLVQEQRMIFEKAICYVRPGGKIVYATCSIFDAENENQIAYFQKILPLLLEKPPLKILPERGGPDGFFGAVFVKSDNLSPLREEK